MNDLKGKVLPLILIVLLVLIVLLSNFGQNFKNDIFSYNNALSHSKNFTAIWSDTKDYQEYIDKSSNYVINFLSSNNVAPLDKNSYIEEWPLNLPAFKYESTLEVISIYGRIIKKYNYGIDFFEDFRGSTKSGIVRSKASYLDNININKGMNREVLLFDGYKNRASEEIYSIDATLHSLGAAGVISPSYSGDLKYESNLYELNNQSSDTGIVKLLASQPVFNELKEFAKKGYTIKIKSGAEVKSVNNKNIYAVINGKNASYKPLIIVTFYDGIIKTNGASLSKFDYYTISASMVLESIKALKFQRMSSPDRTIVFAFLSNKSYGKEGLKKLLNKNLDGDIIVLDGIGTDATYSLSYTKYSRTLTDTLEYFLEKSGFKVTSKNIDITLDKNFVNIFNSNFNDGPFTDYQMINNSGRFILSLIGDECFNLDILSGNVRQIRSIKRFVRANSIILSLIALVSLIYIVFKKSSIK